MDSFDGQPGRQAAIHSSPNRMGYFDAYTANLFRATRDGQRVFAPLGKFGAVYTVPSDEEAGRIARVARRLYQLMLAGIVGVQIVLGWRWNLVCGVLWLAVFYGVLQREARRLPRTALRVADLAPLSRRERQARAGRALGMGWLVTMLAVSAVFVATGAWLWFRSGDPSMLFAVAFFGLCGAIAVYQIVVVRRSAPPSPPASPSSPTA